MVTRRSFLRMVGVSGGALLGQGVLGAMERVWAQESGKRPNILLITADDLGWDSVGAFGCTTPNITPHIDRLAGEGMSFDQAHVMVTICGPSRSALMSGRYPHCSGSMGHGNAAPPPGWEQPRVQAPDLSTYLHQHDYLTGALRKVGRVIQKTFDFSVGTSPYGMAAEDRDPQAYYNYTKEFLSQAKKAGKPFFFYNNIIDPHRPWPNTKMEKDLLEYYTKQLGSEKVTAERFCEYPPPSRTYRPSEVDVPAFLPDWPEIREHIVPYYDSVKRMDDIAGEILRALDESGMADNTIVVFLSDHGAAVPGGKWSLYHYGTKTPLIVRWPGKVKPATRNESNVVSAIDIMPTLIEAIGLPAVQGIEGQSFLPLLQGRQPDDPRQTAYMAFNWLDNASEEQAHPMRAITSSKYLYIWNAFATRREQIHPHMESGNPVIAYLAKHGKDDPRFARRAHEYVHRPVQEFFDLTKDPGCWDNLIDDSSYRDHIEKMQRQLLWEMTTTNDPELDAFTELIQS